MDILKKFTLTLYDEDEYKKIDDFIQVNEKENYQGFYYHNVYFMTNDLAYSKLLDLDINSYRNIIYYNCEIFFNENKTGTFFLHREDAIKKKRLLIILLLNRYNTYNNMINRIHNIICEKK